MYNDKEDQEKEMLERAYRRAREYADLEPEMAKRLDVEREFAMKQREIALKENELTLKRREASRSFSNPVLLGVIAATIGLFGNLYVSEKNARSQEELQERTAEAQLALQKDNNATQNELERKKEQSAMILDALKAPTQEERCTNLLMLGGTGLTETSYRLETLCSMTAVYNRFVHKPEEGGSATRSQPQSP